MWNQLGNYNRKSSSFTIGGTVLPRPLPLPFPFGFPLPLPLPFPFSALCFALASARLGRQLWIDIYDNHSLVTGPHAL
jgi:hypothetical protein